MRLATIWLHSIRKRERPHNRRDEIIKLIKIIKIIKTEYPAGSGWNSMDFIKLNQEFQELLYEHSDDKKMNRPEDEKEVREGYEEYLNEQELSEMVTDLVPMYNAYNELCDHHPGLREVSEWSFGAQWEREEYRNAWDVFVEAKDYEPVCCRTLEEELRTVIKS